MLKVRGIQRELRAVACLAIGCAAGLLNGKPACGQSPADELAAALRDLQTVTPAARPSIRYLSLYAIDEQDRPSVRRVVSYAVNAMSRTRAITPIRVVSPTLIRVNLADYAPRQREFHHWRAAWEKLVEFDPYWHIRTQVVSNLKSEISNSKVVTVDGGWVGLENAARLRAWTLSQGAILRADYFIATALVPPRYYEFTGIPPKEADLLRSVGIDLAAIDRLRANVGANLVQSGVTFKPRRIIWSHGPRGGAYMTLDVERVDAERDPLRRPVNSAGLTMKYDAGEWFVMAPNGLWWTAIYDSQGVRQDSVPDRVAKDTSDPHGDGIIVPLVSCIRCHVEAGLRPFVDDQSRLLAKASLHSIDPEVVVRTAEFYDEPRLQRQMAYDRETYAASCAEATGGMQPERLAAALASAVRNYAYLPVTLEQAARECNTTAEQFRAANVATRDPILLTLLAGRSVLRDQWTSSFAEAIVAVEARQQ